VRSSFGSIAKRFLVCASGWNKEVKWLEARASRRSNGTGTVNDGSAA
jgi:hypothetical protein